MGGKSDLVQNTGRRVTAQRERAAGFGLTFEARLRVERSVPWLTILQPRPRVTSEIACDRQEGGLKQSLGGGLSQLMVGNLPVKAAKKRPPP